MEDHAHGMAVTGPDPADAVAQINQVEAARPPHRPVMHSKHLRVALAPRSQIGLADAASSKSLF